MSSKYGKRGKMKKKERRCLKKEAAEQAKAQTINGKPTIKELLYEDKTRRPAVRPKSRWSRFWISFWTIVGVLATLMAFSIFWPRPSVVVSDPVDPKNALSASFTVTNDNFIPLTDVSISVGLGKLSYANYIVLESKNELQSREPNFVSKDWDSHYFRMDDRFTGSLTELVSGSFINPHAITDGDISIIVRYRPWVLPFHLQKSFRFTTIKQTNGNIYWYAKPLL